MSYQEVSYSPSFVTPDERPRRSALTQKLIGELRAEFVTLALEVITDLPVNAETDFIELSAALSKARPQWGLKESNPIESVWELLEQESQQKLSDVGGTTTTTVKRERTRLPKELWQMTFREARNACVAIADGALLRRWEEIRGETALHHVMEGEPLSVKLSAGQSLAGLGHDSTYDDLREELKALDARSVLLFHVLIGLALQEAHVTLELDDLIRAVGWQPHDRQERAEMRRRLFRTLIVIDSITVHGRRTGTYRDPVTKDVLDLTIVGKLVMLSELQFAEQSSEQAEPPVIVTLTAGPFLDKFRGNHQVLQHFGNVRKLTELPTGKPSGAWALSIGLALNQLWREGASRVEVANAGDDGHKTVRYQRPFTRRQLLDMFRSEPLVGDVLRSKNPMRAQQYWSEAISLLKKKNIIGHYKELDKLPDRRSGWQDFWLNHQRLDIRPKGEGLEAVLKLARKAKRMLGKGQAVKSPSIRRE
jgi:hypothetical protein